MTKVVVQVSLFDPSATALRVSMQGISVVLDQRGIRTHSTILVKRSMAVLTEGFFRKRQIQELVFTVHRRNRFCVLTLAPYSEVYRVFPCPTHDTFHIHGNNITLHTLFLHNDDQEVARWDFSIPTQSSNSQCRECPFGTVLNSTTLICHECLTGLHVNVDAHSEWWHDSTCPTNDATAELAVPSPYWAVLLPYYYRWSLFFSPEE